MLSAVPAKVTTPGYIYFIHCEGYLKIGMSTLHPRERLQTMQTGCPFPLELVAVWTMDIAFVRIAERFLHERFGDRRHTREWFAIDADRLEGAKEALSLHLREARVIAKKAAYRGHRRLSWRNVTAPPLEFEDLLPDLDHHLTQAMLARVEKSAAISARFAAAEQRRALMGASTEPVQIDDSATTSR